MDIPVLRTAEVIHIGTLVEKRRGERGESLEGHCLSVSHTPHAWRQIAKLGGLPVMRLLNHEGVFVDLLALMRDEALRGEIEAWGLREGLAYRATKWRSWSFDDEDESWRYSLHDDQASAEAELYDEDARGPDDGPAVDSVEILCGTVALADRVMVNRLDRSDAFEYVAMVWAEDYLPEADGVWWREDYAPESYSAPRGGIFPSRLERWKPAPCDVKNYEDDASGSLLDADLIRCRQKPVERC